MTKVSKMNPIINAVSASAYILVVSSILNLVTQTQNNKPDTFFAPVAFLSLFTLSAAIMAYLFFYQPLQLLIDGKHKEAVRLFLQTISAFGVITLVIWGFVIVGVL